MFIATLCDSAGGCRAFGPFETNFDARDWAMECQGLGFFPHATFTTYEIEEPYDLGFDPGN